MKRRNGWYKSLEESDLLIKGVIEAIEPGANKQKGASSWYITINNYSILNDGKYFGENVSQTYLVFQPFSKYITGFRNTIKIDWMTVKTNAGRNYYAAIYSKQHFCSGVG